MARKKEPTGAIANTGESTKRKRVGKPPDAPPPAITDEIRNEWWAKALRAKLDVDDAAKVKKSKDSAYQSVLKAAKKVGVNIGALKRNIADKDRDPLEVAREHQEYERQRELLGVPVGAKQAEMFEETGEHRGTLQERAYQVGLSEGKTGKTYDPDRYPNDTDCQDRYQQGWQDGQETLTIGLGKGPKLKNGGASASAPH